ncbi:hypothetical protein [Alteromonas halophila]|uniref:PEP-CTERM sorting domain-containing protein n=1 Tax=Alteromonas halophila TaxID=516698 RepID=A0A918JN90_9ALTE|nr:hypothetical protein [Alteromonas halophila]GGW91958.1 hypothetical protein GCM10007391_27760 [Alteromonas halophila]
MKNRIFIALLAGMIASGSASASFIDSKDFSSKNENSYWTNHDLGLDFLRLEWADTLGADVKNAANQKTLEDFNTFVETNDEGWRFATMGEFDSYINWFDSDPNIDGWSLAQNEGGNLFFDLNGLGGGFQDQYGFDHEGYTYWQVGTLNPDAQAGENPFHYVWFADFGDQDSRVTCVEWSVLCQASFFPTFEGYMPDFSSFNAISATYQKDGFHDQWAGNPLNYAPLLVRDVGGPSSSVTTSVNEPATGVLASLAILGMMMRRRLVRNQR